ncbi:MAG: TonB-dependent receptor [Chitinophagaceae bacterium]|nr:MAG: TonB-dependent receptor [Chitinophagaceae bacterium]
MRFAILFFLLLPFSASAQAPVRTLRVADAASRQPLEGATILLPDGSRLLTDERGAARIRVTGGNQMLRVQALGHAVVDIAAAALPDTVFLQRRTTELQQVTITGAGNAPMRSISGLDIQLRGINNSQEVLRMVPGLFIGQHAGGGKAEQLFLRGFDLDHGTDIAISVDGMPVNLVSHAHGQGYADLHFLIPELIEKVDFRKGAYDAAQGNFATTGHVGFQTLTQLPASEVKVEGASFSTFRTVGKFDLAGRALKARGQSAYIAAEYMRTRGYFENPQDFHRYNLFGKWQGRLGRRNVLTASVSNFSSGWDASGQIPERAVNDGSIGYFGAIDPNEGGTTARSNANLQLVTTLADGSWISSRAYYSHYRFRLYSNFTFFKEDPVNGDQIRQQELRDLYGYNGSYHRVSWLGRTRFTSELGLQLRADRTYGSELSRTIARDSVSEALMLGNIGETNLAAYIGTTASLGTRVSLQGGLRWDRFFNRYTDVLNAGMRSRAGAGTWSPKLTLTVQAKERLQVYASGGKGFHSNDTRVVVPQQGRKVLPAAWSADLGAIWKPAPRLLVQGALWYLWLDQEFVYVGDEGVVEAGGRSRRIGADLSVRWQPVSWLYADADLNYAHARAADAAKGEDFLPLAPGFTSIGGVTAKTQKGWSFALRYRYMADRPANETNSVVAKGYFVCDAQLGWQCKRWEAGVSAQNVFDVRWKETQFDTESQLRHEVAPVSEIHFTPGTPFALKASLALRF